MAIMASATGTRFESDFDAIARDAADDAHELSAEALGRALFSARPALGEPPALDPGCTSLAPSPPHP